MTPSIQQINGEIYKEHVKRRLKRRLEYIRRVYRRDSEIIPAAKRVDVSTNGNIKQDIQNRYRKPLKQMHAILHSKEKKRRYRIQVFRAWKRGVL